MCAFRTEGSGPWQNGDLCRPARGRRTGGEQALSDAFAQRRNIP
ncbi:hypothetical protein SUDANB70_00109 [Streptomyces sp. enrichment culture]